MIQMELDKLWLEALKKNGFASLEEAKATAEGDSCIPLNEPNHPNARYLAANMDFLDKVREEDGTALDEVLNDPGEDAEYTLSCFLTSLGARFGFYSFEDPRTKCSPNTMGFIVFPRPN